MEYYEVSQGLIIVYNELLKIHTSGQDSFIYTSCMKSLMDIIQFLSTEQENKKQEE